MGMNRRHFIQSCTVLAAFYSLPAFSRSPVAEALFGTLPANGNIQKVITAGPPADLLMFALAPENMVGFAAINLKKGNSELFAPQWMNLPVYGRLAGRGSTLSLEQLLAYHPDLILDTGNIDETYRSQAEKVAKQTGIPYLLMDGKLIDAPQQLRQLGRLLNANQQAEKLSMIAERYLSNAQQFALIQQQKPLSFYLARGAKGLQTGTKGSIHTEAIEMLGFRNVVGIDGFHGLTDVSMEQLYQWEPDIIITQYDESVELITRSPLWAGLKAVSSNNFFVFSGMPFGWLDGPPGINRLLGMRRLQSHFDKAVEETITHDLRQFFELFYHSSLTQEQVDLLMERS